MRVLNDAWNEILLSSAQRIVGILLYDRYIPCELTGEKRPTPQLQTPPPRSALCVKQVDVCCSCTLPSGLIELAASYVALAKRQIESIFHVMVLALGKKKKTLTLWNFLTTPYFYLGSVQSGLGLFVHGTPAFCPFNTCGNITSWSWMQTD